MSFLRSFSIFIVSLLFVLSASSAITWYNLKDVLDKQNLKGFIVAEIVPDLINNQCSDMCSQYNATNCMETCISQVSNEADINKMVDDTLSTLYSKEFGGVSIDKAIYYLNLMFLPFVILSVITAILLVFLSREPFRALGHNLIVIAIASLLTGMLPKILPLFFPVLQGEGMVQRIQSYVFSGFYKEFYFGIGFLIAGFVFYILNYYHERSRSQFEEIKKTKLKKNNQFKYYCIILQYEDCVLMHAS